MSRNRTAVFVFTLALAIATPNLAFAAAQPRAESSDFVRADRDSVIGRAIRSIKRLILHVLAEPQSPPPAPGQ